MSKKPRAGRPNFLVIMTDQQRGDCLGIEGHPCLLTPNMDSIAGEGVRFSRCYSTCPSCIPARRSFLSGRFPATHGMVGYEEDVEWRPPATLPGVLSAAGYQTYLVGRSMHQHPVRKRFGFDHMVISSYRLNPNGYHEFLARRQPEGAGGYYGTGAMHNDRTGRPWHMVEGLHHTNWTVNEALRFLRDRDPSCPYFLVVSFIAPHPPLVPPAFYFERYLRLELPEPAIGDWAAPPPNDGRGLDVGSVRTKLAGEALRSCLAGYFGLINHIDDQIRRFLNCITGIDRNTAVIFTSDHGEMLGDHYFWGKRLPYEGAARVPLLVKGAEGMDIPRGLLRDEPVALEDIMPTVLDMAGVEIPDSVEGRSLLPLLRGEEPGWRGHLHIEHAPLFHALCDGEEKYVWFVEDGREQLFHLSDDPHERRDLAGKSEFADRLLLWRERLVRELEGRPEGFTDGGRLVPGRPYRAVMPGVSETEA